jgi:SAM-dependent methyltransferase
VAGRHVAGFAEGIDARRKDLDIELREHAEEQSGFPDNAFDLVCAFDIVEHVEDDHRVFAELSRTARPGATVMLSVPLHRARWTAFDALVGHVRRYEPDELLAMLGEHGLTIERTAVFGMEPRSKWLLDFAVWGLTKRRVQALRWYNALVLPLGLLMQRRLEWGTGLIDVDGVGELLLACRRPDAIGGVGPIPSCGNSAP